MEVRPAQFGQPGLKAPRLKIQCPVPFMATETGLTENPSLTDIPDQSPAQACHSITRATVGGGPAGDVNHALKTMSD
jgi:hypothetical protein